MTYRIREFARLTGATVRALRHYDRLGLLRPRRSAAGYRLYTAADHDRLDRIVALKAAGLSLLRIGEVRRFVRSTGGRACRSAPR